MNITGFIKWQLEGWYRSITVWAVILAVMAFAAAIWGCPKPIPAVMLVVAALMALADLCMSWFRFSYSLFEIEQTRVEREQQGRS